MGESASIFRLGLRQFAAPLAIPLGHRSDHRPYRGYHRTPYIAAGTGVTVLTAALAPLAALFIAHRTGHPLVVALGVALFLRFFGGGPAAYALVFAIEAAGLMGMILLLWRVDVEAFHREIAWLSAGC